MARIRSRYRRGNLLDTDDFLHNSGHLISLHPHYNPYPSTNVKHHQEYYDLEIAVPGFKKEEIQLLIKDGYLIVKGHKESDRDMDKTQFIRKEHDLDSFERTFQLGDITDEENIKAKYENGMLKIRLFHKTPVSSPDHPSKQINIL